MNKERSLSYEDLAILDKRFNEKCETLGITWTSEEVLNEALMDFERQWAEGNDDPEILLCGYGYERKELDNIQYLIEHGYTREECLKMTPCDIVRSVMFEMDANISFDFVLRLIKSSYGLDLEEIREQMDNISVSDYVIYQREGKFHYSKVLSIALRPDEKNKNGKLTESVPFKDRDGCIFDLDDGHWTLGGNITKKVIL